MKKRMISFLVFVAMILCISISAGLQKENRQSAIISTTNAFAAVTSKASGSPKQNFALSAAGIYISTCVGCAVEFAWGGLIGMAAGVVVGL